MVPSQVDPSGNLMVFDFETTGDNPRSARAVQMAALLVSAQGEVTEYETLCDPGIPIGREAQAVHGISAEQVAGAPRDDEVVQAFMAPLLESGAPLVLAGHFSRFYDEPILRRLAEPLVIPPVLHVDTYVLASRIWPSAPTHKLSRSEAEAAEAGERGKIGLTQWLGLGDGAGAHDALEDVRMVKVLLDHIADMYDTTIPELAQYCDTPVVLKTCHFGKHKGKPWGRGPGCVPMGYCMSMLNWMEDPSPDMRATLSHHYGLTFR